MGNLSRNVSGQRHQGIAKSMGKGVRNLQLIKAKYFSTIGPGIISNSKIYKLPDSNIIKGKATPKSTIKLSIGNQAMGRTNVNKKGNGTL